MTETNRRTRVYVAGPYTSDPEVNTEYALWVGDQLLGLGFAPMVPHLTHFMHERRPQDYRVWMELDLSWMECADVVLRIDGESSGADEETALADELGIPVIRLKQGVWDPRDEWFEAGLRRTHIKKALAGTPHVVNDRHLGDASDASDGVPWPVDAALQRMRKVFASKNADYADDRDWKSNFVDVAEQLGFDHATAAEVLIAVKQARLKSLRVNGRTPANEAVEDTILDRAVYSLIALAFLEEDQ